MNQSRAPRGVPSGGEFTGNAHDEAAPMSDGFDDSGAKSVPKDEIKVGDIVWDGDEGFTVSRVEHNHIGRMESWTRGKDARPSVALYSERGDFWGISPSQESVTVLRDIDTLHQHIDDLEDY